MTDVSRETPSTPEAARRAFSSERLPLAERYVELLATAGVERGLIGPREAPKLWDRHVLNCLALTSLVPPGATVADLGSGAGLPGLVLAIGRPDLTVTLVEPLQRRTTFLDEVIDELGLEDVRVVRGRAEELHGRERFDVVTARALAPLDRLLGWGMPLVAADRRAAGHEGELRGGGDRGGGDAAARAALCAPGDPAGDGTGRIVHSHRGHGWPMRNPRG